MPFPPYISFLAVNETNGITFYLEGYETWPLNLTIKTNTWHQLTFTLDGNQPEPTDRVRLYLNGKSQTIFSDKGPAYLNPPSTILLTTLGVKSSGGESFSSYFEGAIDEVRFYNRTLSAQDVAQLYAYESQNLPALAITVKTVQVTLYLQPGRRYQLEASTDLATWSPVGSAFTATAPILTQDFEVAQTGRFWRLIEAP